MLWVALPYRVERGVRLNESRKRGEIQVGQDEESDIGRERREMHDRVSFPEVCLNEGEER